MKKDKPMTGTKFSIAMPADLLAQLDAACVRSGGIGRAALIRAAVTQMLKQGNIVIDLEQEGRKALKG